MQYAKESARRIGWLFVAATVAGVLSAVVTSQTLGEDDLLAAVHAEQGRLLVGEMLVLVMLAAMAATAVLLVPVLRAHSEQLALGYLVARALEVVVIAVGVIAALLLIPLSWATTETADGGAAGADVVAESLRAAGDWTGYLGAQMIFSISALILNWAFLRSGLLPRWLALWGVAGVPLMFASGLLTMIEPLNSHAAALNLLVVPLAVQEMVMAIWMIVRGFADVPRHHGASEMSAPLASAR